VWVERFKQLAPIAKITTSPSSLNSTAVLTGTGEACAAITREVNHPNVKVNYDAGNVMDYLDVDPIPDIKKCADEIRSFCIKDHRNFPKDQTAVGLWRDRSLQASVGRREWGRTIPLCCENIFRAAAAPPDAKGVDELAKRAREFLEIVIAGLRARDRE